MSKLNTPFAQTTSITIVTGKSTFKVGTELASSDIEIFQSLNYRSKKEFTKPLTLRFGNPLAQSFVKFNFNFSVELIAVDYLSHKVKKLQVIPAKKGGGDFIQGFSEYSIVVFAPIGFSKAHKIKEGESTLTSK
jgi:hypothetical protein